MSDFQDQPGGGFSSVGGYNDPAGSQADEMRRMQEDEMNRQRMEQAANDAAAAQAAQEASYSQTAASPGRSANRQPRGTAATGSAGARSQKTASGSRKATKSPAARPAADPNVNPGFAILGFIGAGLWGMGLLEDDGRWFSGAIVGMLGAYVAGRYYKFLITAGVVVTGWWFLAQFNAKPSGPEVTGDKVAIFAPSEPETTTALVTRDTESDRRPSVKELFKPVRPKALSVEEELAKYHPYPPKPNILDRPHQPLKDDPADMRAFREMMFDYEKKTGKSFLTEHPSMKPASRERYDYVARYDKDGLREGDLPIPLLSEIQGVWDYDGPQLWELDLNATIDQHFLYQRTSSTGVVRNDVFRTYSGDGLCYKPLTRPLFREGFRYESFQVPVRAGKVWRQFARSVYHAKTDAELIALDPINQAIQHTHQAVAQAKKRYQSDLKETDRRRAASLPFVRAAWKLRQ